MAHEAIRRWWQAAIVTIFRLLLLHARQLLLQRADRFLLLPDRLARFFERLAQGCQFLAQYRILLTEVFQLFVFGHAATLADLASLGNLHGPSE